MQPADPGIERKLNEPDLDSEDNVNWNAIIDNQSPTNCLFIDFDAVESDERGEITDSEEEEMIPPCKKGQIKI